MQFKDKLLSKHAFSHIVMGNEAIVRAMIETNTRVVTSYPGSPTPEIAGTIKSMGEKRPFYFEFSTNEKVASEIAYGATVNGHLSCVFFKSVGLNVASDLFVQLSMMELIGGMVVVIGDDPGAHSSQNEQDNRHYAYMAYTPVFEPSDPREVYLMYKEAVKLSVSKKMPVILRLSTHVCHARTLVEFNEWSPSEHDDTPRFDPANGPYLPVTKLIHPLKRKALVKLRETAEYSEESGQHISIDNGNAERGVITFGLTYLSLLDVLEYADNKKPDILKLGMVYPLPKKKIADFLRTHKEVKVLEELDDILEKEVKVLAYELGIKTKIIGKKDLDDWGGEYTPTKVYSVLNKTWPDLLKVIAGPPSEEVPSVPVRLPQLCPGCGHRSAFYAIKKALNEKDITVADIGCHTLGFLPPYNMGQLLMCMGASIGIGSGLSLFNKTRKVVAFIGDSTFYHAGSAGVLNAVFNKYNLTLIVMDNGTTAMTGHQNHPGSGANFDEKTERIPIPDILKAYGVKVKEVDTYNQAALTSTVKEFIGEEGFNVVIARHPCMLKFSREQRRKPSYEPVHAFINQNKCDRKYVCVGDFACPSFVIKESGEVYVNEDLCIGDGSCLQTCPSHAIALDFGGENNK